jgi:hypothetical protein
VAGSCEHGIMSLWFSIDLGDYGIRSSEPQLSLVPFIILSRANSEVQAFC